jgi:8-oxo-dGTP pyrophosphatase MutT (NUDIX family)
VTIVKEISAGGVVYRRNGDALELLMIEDRYSKWTLAKGKKEPGETDEETALREIEEETGVRGRIIAKLETVHYRYFHPKHGDVDKEVHYYLVEARSDDVTPQLSEITKAVWLPVNKAWQLQKEEGYDNNRSVILKALNQLGVQPS